jgi:hypothetical protein
LYALIGGTVAGTFWPTIAPITAEVTGLSQLPAALSITWVNLILPLTFAEPIALAITQHTGQYLGAQLFTGFMYLAAAICVWTLKVWKIGELEGGNITVLDRSSGAKSGIAKRLFTLRKV